MCGFHAGKVIKTIAIILGVAQGTHAGISMAQEAPSFTKGLAQMSIPSMFKCAGLRSRLSPVGTIRSDDGRQWVVPANTHFKTAAKAPDLYNPCNGVQPKRLSDIDLKNVPVIDAGGRTTFTAFIFADNYFEFYVNGKLLAVDAVPFTPFNSSVIRFKANRPFTVAVMGVDWEENLGIGSERGRGVSFHPGDAGFIAVIKNDKGQTVAVTDKSWRAQTFYTAPLNERSCLKLKGSVRDSSKCSTESVREGRSFAAAHWPIPSNWFKTDFNDSSWPMAVTFTNETVGVVGKPSYMNFREVFDDPQANAKFIWSSNLILDNLVLMRKTVQ